MTKKLPSYYFFFIISLSFKTNKDGQSWTKLPCLTPTKLQNLCLNALGGLLEAKQTSAQLTINVRSLSQTVDLCHVVITSVSDLRLETHSARVRSFTFVLPSSSGAAVLTPTSRAVDCDNTSKWLGKRPPTNPTRKAIALIEHPRLSQWLDFPVYTGTRLF